MDSEKSIPEVVLVKSSSRDSRVVCEILSRSGSQQKPDIRNKGKKGHRSGNDLFVCFAPRASLNLLHRAIPSPGREKGREAIRRSSKSSSGPIFSLPGSEKAGKKQSYEAEEPTSPKVTCIGQVRVRPKHGNTRESAMQDRNSIHQDKKRNSKTWTGSASPGSASSSPSRQLKWTPFFGSKKERNAPAPYSSFGKEFSCFGLSCESPAHMPYYREGQNCKAVFAKSLILLQETEEKHQLKGERAGEQANAEDLITSQDGDALAACSRNEERQPDYPESDSWNADEEIVLDARVDVSSSMEDADEEGVSEPSPPPPPPHALLLMRRKLEPLKVSATSPSANSILKRSSSAPPQCRLQIRGKGEDVTPAAFHSGKNSGQGQGDDNNSSAKKLQRSDSPKASLKRSISDSTRMCPGLVPERCLARVVGVDQISFDEQRRQLDAVLEETTTQEPSGEGPQVDEPRTEEVGEALSFLRRRSVSEALKVSLDVVPETWLWKSCTIVRTLKEGEGDPSGGRPDSSRGPMLPDAEIEASLWRSCYVSRRFKDDDDGDCEERVAEDDQLEETKWLGSELKGCLWRSCSISKKVEDIAHQEESQGDSKLEETLLLDAEVEASQCSSVQTPGEGRDFETVCADLGDQEALNMAEDMEGSIQKESESNLEEKNGSLGFTQKKDDLTKEIRCTDAGEKDRCTDAGEMEEGQPISQATKGISAEEGSLQKDLLVKNKEEKQVDALLLLTYKMEALRVSVDGTQEGIFDRKQGEAEIVKPLIERRVPHFLEIGSYLQVMKAGKDYTNPCTPVSLPGGFQLQRCKSEPVRLTL